MSGAERRAKRDLDAARVRGDLPPEQDAVTGELINPHIPEFMAKAPWYAATSGASGPSLSHQRLAPGAAGGDQSIEALAPLYARGERGSRATTFRDGACRNCGAATHKEKDCVERPRKVGAWKSRTAFAADEVLPGFVGAGVKLGWDAKRDSYAGYDGAAHTDALTVRFAAIEEERAKVRAAEEAAAKAAAEKAAAEKAAARKARKAAAAAAAAAAAEAEGGTGVGAGAGAGAGTGVIAGAGEDSATDSGGDGFGPSSDEEHAVGHKDSDFVERGVPSTAGAKAMMTGWNVRVREDTAKYLLNLDVDSAFYDPKTRSMRENPFAGTEKEGADTLFKGDNAWRATGATREVAQAELFAWDAYNAAGDSDIHLQANPTQTYILKKQVEERKAAVDGILHQRLVATYGPQDGGGGGGAADAAVLPPTLRMGASEVYVEYTPDGGVVRPLEPAVAPTWPRPIAASARDARSAYKEDVLTPGHGAIWGSFFDTATQTWGYACCHNTQVRALCTGAIGREAAAAARKRARVE